MQLSSRRLLTRHRICFARSSNSVTEQQTIFALDEPLHEWLCDCGEAFMLRRVRIENVFEHVLRLFVADDLIVDSAFRWNQSDRARRDDSDARKIRIALNWAYATENLHGIFNKVISRCLTTLRRLRRQHRTGWCF